jgi:hypothetical protein
MKFTANATINYPEDEREVGPVTLGSERKLLEWVAHLVEDPTATSLVIVITKERASE